MHKLSRGLKYSLLLVLTVLIGGTALRIRKHPSDPDLLQRASLVTTLDTPWYLWRTNNLLLIPGPEPKLPVRYNQDLLQLDCVSGQTTRLARVSSTLFDFLIDRSSCLSPDRRHLYLELVREVDQIDLEAKRFTVSKVEHPVSRDIHASNLLWRSDAPELVSLSINRDGFYVIQQSLNGGKKRKGPAFGWPRLSQYWDSMGSRLLGFVRPDRLLCLPAFSMDGSKPNGALHLYEVNLGPSPQLFEYSLPLSEGEEVLDTALSPDCRRLALLVRHIRSPSLPPITQFLSRWRPSLKPKPQDTLSLCTVRLDGSDRQTLGSLPIQNEKKVTALYDSYQPFRLSWLPDGKRLSFLYKKGLRTISIEERSR